MPDFIAQAEEFFAAEIELALIKMELARINNVLYINPIRVMKPSQIAKKERAAKRKHEKELLRNASEKVNREIQEREAQA